ncbi:hypothetical protein [Vibrio aestuarianus]|uniref:hypothetical protein n=1 Tax=Vibrio aestuarianus TaxID=28171 RepID=UPI00237D1B15|nr:hypothetical protein [Vibrio aestuarianus]MDE1332300.1 hypothetical protein [Vibrio aestuarianus]
MARKNKTFTGAEPTWANACVGDNGNPSYVEYAMGFSKAANLLIEQVLHDNIKHAVDEFVYPVCFNMRHSVELRLKGAIEELQKLTSIAGKTLYFDLSGSHDIGKIWQFFKTESETFDSRYETINESIAPVILDIAAVDATGQTFRYPVSVESQKHLVEVKLINFRLLKQSFNKLEEHLDTLHSLNKFLVTEYQYRSFTKKLSRAKLFTITNKLPKYEEWKDPRFDIIKNIIKSDFGISSNDLSKAIDIIKKHFELAPKIGIHNNLHGVDRDDLFLFVKHWLTLHDDAKEKTLAGPTISSSGSIEVFDHLIKSREIKTKIWDDASNWLTAEKLAGFQSLFYFARDLDFSEQYTLIYNQMLRIANVDIKQERDFKQSFMDLLDKTNYFNNTLQSLYFLRYEELAQDLLNHYDWNNIFHWQERAETREMFTFPGYCQYP